MRDLQVPNWFDIVQNRAVNVVLGMLYIDKGICVMLHMDCKIVPEHSAPVAILK